MKSVLLNDINKKGSELFKDNVPGHILINMLMTSRKKYNNNKNINIVLKDDNIYNWCVTFNNFKNDKLNESLQKVKSSYGYDNIQIEILFHDKMFPSYPPFIKIIRPRMSNSLMHRISNLKMVQFDYWTPSRTMDYVIDTLYTIFDKHALIDFDTEMNNPEKYLDGAYHELEGVLVKLASLCDVGNQYDDLDEVEYKKVHDTTIKVVENKNGKTGTGNKYWAAGTGYGSSGSSDWNIDEYVQLHQERDLHIQSIIQRITEVLMNTPPSDAITIYKILESSYLIPYIKTLFKGTTMVEIDKHIGLYKLIFTLLQFLITEDSIFLFDDPNGDQNLYQVLAQMNNEALTVQQISNGADEGDSEYDITSMITSLFDFTTSCFTPYWENKLKLEENMILKKIKEETEQKNEDEKLRDTYFTEISKYKFGMNKFISNGFHYKYSPSSDRKLLRAIGKECSTFTKSLPIHFGSSICARVDSTNSRCIRVIITGPNSTPYDSGVHILMFIFQMVFQTKTRRCIS